MVDCIHYRRVYPAPRWVPRLPRMSRAGERGGRDDVLHGNCLEGIGGGRGGGEGGRREGIWNLLCV